MIIIRLSGGLGNQLFQYAMGRQLAQRHGTTLKLDVSWFATGPEETFRDFPREVKLSAFEITAPIASAREIRRLRGRAGSARLVDRLVEGVRRRLGFAHRNVREQVEIFDPDCVELPDDVYLDGFWQSEAYFSWTEPILRAELTLRDRQITSSARECVEGLRQEGKQVVAVHVRRGDIAYAHEKLDDPLHVHGPCLGKEYFLRAAGHFDPADLFLVFSDGPDDIRWCRENLDLPNVHFSEGRTDLEDFAVMQLCDHNIISNSTFSWWAAWLNPHPGKKVVAPQNWFHEGRVCRAGLEGLIPKGWIVI